MRVDINKIMKTIFHPGFSKLLMMQVFFSLLSNVVPDVPDDAVVVLVDAIRVPEVTVGAEQKDESKKHFQTIS